MLEMPLEPPETKAYICPICGEELSALDYLYFNEFNECVGCESCISHKFAGDVYDSERI